MRRIAVAAVLMFAVAPVFASSFAGTSAGSASDASSDGSSASSGSSSGDEKLILAAREEAAGFIATAGAVRGARLQAALLHLRETQADAALASDLELARGILAR
ncbi:hypothetical protein ABB30_02875 [Stenotrophomonas ginsengisoli]|uniref:DUF2388 domain-containing protein n=1 Tax=Stenotrophomonas ginsengisoli TaxID=336566 RepID=A0A0R0DL14_9GAMM|nr:DUF2388 domain-containing protein [Stenotrophomonas ginsengisoli]KRG78986.1 hypothetical protein ABB30_02875 [Stenotrophomonas ginsengisoli]